MRPKVWCRKRFSRRSIRIVTSSLDATQPTTPTEVGHKPTMANDCFSAIALPRLPFSFRNSPCIETNEA